jgi:hypothetical protein
VFILCLFLFFIYCIYLSIKSRKQSKFPTTAITRMPFQSSLAYTDLQQQHLLVPFSKPPILCTSPTNLSQNPNTINRTCKTHIQGVENSPKNLQNTIAQPSSSTKPANIHTQFSSKNMTIHNQKRTNFQ